MQDTYQLDLSNFNVSEQQFDRHSDLHGVMHTYRVMLHVLRLGIATGHIAEAKSAFFAAYIHDMARKSDGYCIQHGADAAIYKLPNYEHFFIENGAKPTDIPTIGKACTWHSLNKELINTDPDWKTVALLKDADALDRLRLGDHHLDVSYLRFKETHDHIKFARELHFQTNKMNNSRFIDVLNVARLIELAGGF